MGTNAKLSSLSSALTPYCVTYWRRASERHKGNNSTLLWLVRWLVLGRIRDQNIGDWERLSGEAAVVATSHIFGLHNSDEHQKERMWQPDFVVGIIRTSLIKNNSNNNNNVSYFHVFIYITLRQVCDVLCNAFSALSIVWKTNRTIIFKLGKNGDHNFKKKNHHHHHFRAVIIKQKQTKPILTWIFKNCDIGMRGDSSLSRDARTIKSII